MTIVTTIHTITARNITTTNTFKIKKLALGLVAVSAVALSAPTFAQGFYIGAGVSQAFIDENGFDEDDTGGKIFGGYNFNDYFAIDYADQLGTIPFISFAFMSEFAKFKQMAFSFKGEFGYSYKQGTFKASSSAGPDIEDSITLQWVPVVAGILTDYTPSWARWIKPSLEVVAGAHWLNHVGTLDGLDQSVWVPVYGGGVSLTFFPGSKTDVFGGITFAADYMQSINSDQRIRGWMYKLGSTILL